MSEVSWVENTVACSISIHSWGNSKGVKAATLSSVSHDLAEKAANKRVSVSKRLIECEAYKAIVSRDGHAGRWFAEHSVPSLFRRGVYAVPLAFLDEWTAYLTTYQEERAELVELFINAYNDAAESARRELGALYNADDYPGRGEVYARFWVDVRYLELTVPGSLARIAPETFRQAQADFLRSIEEGKTAIEHILAQEATELVQGLRHAMQGLDDGTLKRFHDSHVDKVREWADLFIAGRNVTNSTELADVVTAMKDIASSTSIPALKTFAGVRQTIKAELGMCADQLKGFLEARPARRIQLDD